MGSPPAVTLSTVHEGYLIAAIIICILQFLFYRLRVSALQSEVARLHKERESMEIEANYDTLTGLPNRRNFEAKLQAVIEELETRKSPCSLMMIDFDHFKSINDSFGHQSGDEVLKHLAEKLLVSLQGCDRGNQVLCSRYGGDEFSVILPSTGVDEAGEFAEGLRTSIESLDLEFNGVRCPLTISLGVATYPAETSEPKTLLELADQALYRAKSNGRNQVCRPAPDERKS